MNLLNKDINAICDNIKDISHMFHGKKIIITGGQGFLGQYVCAALNRLNTSLATPCTVIVVDSNITSEDNKELYYNNFQYLHTKVEENIDIGPIDYILFLAGIASPFYYKKYPLETINIISIGLANYLKIAKKYNAKLLFASSSEIYGNPDEAHIPTAETYNGNVSTLSERSCYDESKRLGETLCHLYAKQNTETSMARIFNCFGPLMQSTDYRVLPNFSYNIFNNIPVQLYGDGKQTRTFCYISDTISGLFRALLLGKTGQAYNIGNPNSEISMNDLLDLCENILNTHNIEHPTITRTIIKNPEHYPVNGDPTRRCPDITKARQELNYDPKVSLQDGLLSFFKWTKRYYER